jgi:hypothetical protein
MPSAMVHFGDQEHDESVRREMQMTEAAGIRAQRKRKRYE